MTVEKSIPKQLLRPITTGASCTISKSEFQTITCNLLKAWVQITLQSLNEFVVSVPSFFPKRPFKQPPFLLAEPSVRKFFTCCNHFLIVADAVSQRHQEGPVQETRSSPNRTDAANNSVPVAKIYEEDGNYW